MTVAATLQGLLFLHTGDFPIAVSLALMGGRSLETLCHSPKDVDDLAKNNDGQIILASAASTVDVDSIRGQYGTFAPHKVEALRDRLKLQNLSNQTT